MLCNKNMEKLCKISTNVNAKEMKIWELQQYHICMTKEIEKISKQIEQMKTRMQQLENEDDQLQSLSKQLEKSIELQQCAIPVDNQIITHLNLYKRQLNELNTKFEDNCSLTITKYENDLNECRQNYEKQSLCYKQLHNEQIRLKQLQIKKMWLIVQIGNLQKQRQLFETIQKKKFQSNIIKFAQFCIIYRNYEESFSNLQKMKEVEQTLLKQHLNLQESIKELSRKKTMKPKATNINKRKINDQNYGNSERFQDNYQEFSQKLQAFLTNDFEPNQSASVPQTSRLKAFSNNNQKVQILDVQIISTPKNNNNVLIQNKTINASNTDKSNNDIKSNLNQTTLNLNPPPKNDQIKPTKKEPNELKVHDNIPKNNVKLSQDDQKKTIEPAKDKPKEPSLIQFEQQLAKFNDKTKQSTVNTNNKNTDNSQIESNKAELNQIKFFIPPKRVSFKIDDSQKSTTQTDTDDSNHPKSPTTQNSTISDVELDLPGNESLFTFDRPNNSQIFSKEKTISKEKSNANDSNIFKYPLDDSDHRISEDAEQATTSIEEDPFMFNMSFGTSHENASTSTNLPFSFGQPQKNIFQLF